MSGHIPTQADREAAGEGRINTDHPCRVCAGPCSLTAHQLTKGDYLCVACRNEWHRNYCKKRADSGRPITKAAMSYEYRAAYQQKYKLRPEVRERLRKRAAARKLDPVEREKARVRQQSRKAIASGALVRQPCEVCGAAQVDAHHDDYSQPLNVRWLCRVHHRRLHAAKAKGEAL